jgi:hypothetical protein
MNPIRQQMHKQFAELLGCATDEDYRRKKNALLYYLRHTQPRHFRLEGGRKRAFDRMAEMEGCTVDEALEDQALTGFLVMKSFLNVKKEDALAALADSGIPPNDLPAVEKILEEIYDRIRRA